MTTSLLRRVLYALLASCTASVQSQSHALSSGDAKSSAAISYLITGSVVSSVGGGRVPHCHLTAGLVTRGNQTDRRGPISADTYECDENGRFTIPLPSAGWWRVTASAPGFITQAYEEHQLFSSTVVLTAAKPSLDLEFRISPESSITGIVLDEAGEAVRNAQVSLQTVPEAGPDGTRPPGRVRSGTRTDDRGMYELANVAPGSYRVSVQAQPWYAAVARSRLRGVTSDDPASTEPSPDPSLDVAYPTAWFPGVDDPALAEDIVLHAGEVREADFHLTPVPSIHLHILQASNARPTVMFPMVERIDPGSGSLSFVPVNGHSDAQGQIDIGGLAPGTYQVRVAGPNQEGRSSVVELAAGSVRTLNLADTSNEATVTLHFDGASDSGLHSIHVNFIDTATGRGVVSASGGDMGLRRHERREPETDQTVDMPPGRYEVVMQGRPDLYLTGITAKGAESFGRFVSVAAGASTLTLHFASGRAALTGVAQFGDKPSVGAIVLLVPTSVEDGTSLRIVRRDQTNTDGSFELADVIPGQYILVAIDHGWQINWSDPSTLRRYLTQGVPVDLNAAANIKQNIVAQAP
jgi:hypothetical protein